MDQLHWVIYAVLGAFFAAIVSVLTKRALDQADPFVALSVQSAVMALTLTALMTFFGKWKAFTGVPRGVFGLVIAAGVAAGLSWFFGYRALQMATVAKSTPIDRLSLPMAVILAMIFLRETPSALNFVGIALILAGTFVVVKA
ncbi:MAG TPA: EamA family transporter [Tepidisphaeraceae bacterium]